MMTKRRLNDDDEELPTCDPDVHQCRLPDGDGPPGPGGRSIRIATFANHCPRLRRNADAFAVLSGTSVLLECLGYDDLHSEILLDARTRTGYYDGYVFGPFLTGEMVKADGLHDLTPYVQGGGEAYDLRWNDLLRFNRENAAVYDNKVVLIPLDGDVLSLYYRKDLFEKYDKSPPKTWEEYTELARFFHGKREPLPGSRNETVTLSGSCVGREFRCQEEHWTILILSSMTQHAGTRSGFLFDTTDMEPLLGEAFVRTLQFTEEQFAYGADNEMEGCFDTTNVAKMNAGTCAMTYNWGDSFTEGEKDPPTSYVAGLIGTAHTPGSSAYLDRRTQKLVQCSEEVCSCSNGGEGDEDGSSMGCVNAAPYAAFTGWSGGVSNFASPGRKARATDFFAYASSPAVSLADTIPNVTAGAPYLGVDPFRASHTNARDWIAKGLSEEVVIPYLDTIREQHSHQNAVIDIRIPLTPDILDELNIVMNEHMKVIRRRRDRGLTGDELFSSNEEKWAVENNLRSRWKNLIKTYDRENSVSLLEEYQRSLGIYAPTFEMRDLSKIRPIGLTLCAILLATALGFAGWTFAYRWNNVVRAAQPIFLYTLCFGCFVFGSAIIPLSIDDTIAGEEGASIACMAFPWLVFMGFTTAFSALFSKILRVQTLIRSSQAMQSVTVRHRDVAVPFVVLLLVNVTILLVWTIVNPLTWERTYSMQTLESVGQCASSGDEWKYFISFLAVANFVAIAVANVVAYKCRNMGEDFVESKWIIACTASILEAFLIGAPLLALVSTNPVANYFVSTIIIFIVGESILLFIFVPKIYGMKTRQESRTDQVQVRLPTTRPRTRGP